MKRVAALTVACIIGLAGFHASGSVPRAVPVGVGDESVLGAGSTNSPGPVIPRTSDSASFAPTPSPAPSGGIGEPASAVNRQSREGVASWGYFGGHVVTRLPRGTRICVTGSQGEWCGRSWGFGPEISTGRIADLDRSVFAEVCGSPSRGLCPVVLTWR